MPKRPKKWTLPSPKQKETTSKYLPTYEEEESNIRTLSPVQLLVKANTCNTHEWVVSRIWTSHVTHGQEEADITTASPVRLLVTINTRQICECVITHIRALHITTFHYERVMSHMKRTSEQLLPCGCQWKLNMSQMRMSHNTCHKCEWVITCYKCEWVITYMWAVHTTCFV